jgi:hypothetical protein
VFHLRRRLTEAEARTVGPAQDVRRTAEARFRAGRISTALLRLAPADVLAIELGDYRP